MRTKKQPEFLELLHDFTKEYMPIIAGLSENTIRSYKAAFCLLLTFLNEVKGIAPENITFCTLDYAAITSFLDWLELESHDVSTKELFAPYYAAHLCHAYAGSWCANDVNQEFPWTLFHIDNGALCGAYTEHC